MTIRNLPITACLVLLSTGQLGLGIYHIAIVAITPSMFNPSQNMRQAFRLCLLKAGIWV